MKDLVTMEQKEAADRFKMIVDLHNNADATDKRFDNSINKMTADRRKVREGPAKHKFSEAD